MSVLKRFKVSPSVADPEGIYCQALVVLSDFQLSPTAVEDKDLPELPDSIRHLMYEEAANVGR
jgi:hypothetical protein